MIGESSEKVKCPTDEWAWFDSALVNQLQMRFIEPR